MIKTAKLKKDVKLNPQQERVLRRLEKSPGVLAFHGLGSGKTLTSIAATSGLKSDVVVPASLRENYKKEVRKFTNNSGKRNVMSYEGYLKKGPSGDALVVDEAHLAGRIESQRAKELIRNAPEYQKRVLLTGTPIRNHPVELAPLLRMLRADKEAPTDKKEFTDQFIQEVTKRPGLLGRLIGRTPSTTYSIKNPDKFRKLVRGYVDYHAGSTDDFPEVTEEIVKVPLGKEQRRLYDFAMGKVGPAMRYKIRKGLPPSKKESKQLNAFLGAVRQISNSAQPFGGTEETKIDAAVSEIKNRSAKDKNFKAVAYSNFLGAGVDPLARKLQSEGISYATFTGSQNDKERKKIVDSYNKGKTKVLLLSGAGAQGLDLKGTKLVQLLEPHWNSARLDQAKGRAIRYKSHSHLPEKERKVHVQRFQSVLEPGWVDRMRKQKPGSTDEYLDMLSKSKDELNNQFLNILKEEGAIEKKGAAVDHFWAGFEKRASQLDPRMREKMENEMHEWNRSKTKPLAMAGRGAQAGGLVGAGLGAAEGILHGKGLKSRLTNAALGALGGGASLALGGGLLGGGAGAFWQTRGKGYLKKVNDKNLSRGIRSIRKEQKGDTGAVNRAVLRSMKEDKRG